MPNRATVGPGSRFRNLGPQGSVPSGGAAGQFIREAGHAGRVPRWEHLTMYYGPSIPTAVLTGLARAPVDEMARGPRGRK